VQENSRNYAGCGVLQTPKILNLFGGGSFTAMECLGCGNCQQGSRTYYCTCRNEFVIKEQTEELEKVKNSNWKKGNPQYEKHRRSRRELEKIG